MYEIVITYLPFYQTNDEHCSFSFEKESAHEFFETLEKVKENIPILINEFTAIPAHRVTSVSIYPVLEEE